MAMTMTGEVQLPASRETVWQKLNDPEVLKATIRIRSSKKERPVCRPRLTLPAMPTLDRSRPKRAHLEIRRYH